MQLGRMCLNWKVVAGLAAVAVAVLIAAPHLIGAVLPWLVLAACPLSMVLMMGGMSKMGGKQATQQSLPGSARTGSALSREEQLAQLRGQLADMSARQAALETHIHALEASEPERLRAARPAADESAGSPRYAEAERVN